MNIDNRKIYEITYEKGRLLYKGRLLSISMEQIQDLRLHGIDIDSILDHLLSEINEQIKSQRDEKIQNILGL